MTTNEYLGIIRCIAGLKERTRHAWTRDGRQESVAEHSWRLALMAYFLRDRFPDADLTRVLLMCLLHEGDPGTWLPLEYDLQRTYGVPEAAFSDVLADIRAAVNCEVDALIAAQAASNKQKEQDK